MCSEVIKTIQVNQKSILPKEAAKNILNDTNQKFPIEISIIAKKMGFKVILTNHLPDNDSEIIMVGDMVQEKFNHRQCVFINKYMKPGKRRFVLAYEIGHDLLTFDPSKEKSFVSSYNKKVSDETKETGIIAMIKRIQKFSKSSEDAVIALMEDFLLPESKARDYVSQHWEFTCAKKDGNNGKN